MKFSSWVNQKIQPRRSMLNLKCLVMEKLLWHNQLCCGYGREGKVPWLKRVCSDDLTLWNIVSVILSTPSDILQSKKWEHTATVCLRFCHLIREKKMHEFHPINVSAYLTSIFVQLEIHVILQISKFKSWNSFIEEKITLVESQYVGSTPWVFWVSMV